MEWVTHRAIDREEAFSVYQGPGDAQVGMDTHTVLLFSSARRDNNNNISHGSREHLRRVCLATTELLSWPPRLVNHLCHFLGLWLVLKKGLCYVAGIFKDRERTVAVVE